MNKAKLTPLQVSAAAGCVPVLDVLLKVGGLQGDFRCNVGLPRVER